MWRSVNYNWIWCYSDDLWAEQLYKWGKEDATANIEELEKSREKNKNNLQNNICSWRTYQKELNEQLKKNDWKEEEQNKNNTN